MAETEEDVAHDSGIDSRKGAWSAEEDEQLRSLVAQYGTTCWSQIAAGKHIKLWVGPIAEDRLQQLLRACFLAACRGPWPIGQELQAQVGQETQNVIKSLCLLVCTPHALCRTSMLSRGQYAFGRCSFCMCGRACCRHDHANGSLCLLWGACRALGTRPRPSLRTSWSP
jgi:hypothetical protein